MAFAGSTRSRKELGSEMKNSPKCACVCVQFFVYKECILLESNNTGDTVSPTTTSDRSPPAKWFRTFKKTLKKLLCILNTFIRKTFLSERLVGPCRKLDAGLDGLLPDARGLLLVLTHREGLAFKYNALSHQRKQKLFL